MYISFDAKISSIKLNLNSASSAYSVLGYSFIKNSNTFDQNEWDNLYKLSTNTFVEETDELKKSAAGAGLTDND